MNNEQYASGAQRQPNQGRGRYDLLHAWAMRRIALRCEYGAQLYGDRNWEKGIPQSRMICSALRHLFQYLQGLTDEDHLAAAAWNLLAALDQEERVRAGRLPVEILDIRRPESVDTAHKTE